MSTMTFFGFRNMEEVVVDIGQTNKMLRQALTMSAYFMDKEEYQSLGIGHWISRGVVEEVPIRGDINLAAEVLVAKVNDVPMRKGMSLAYHQANSTGIMDALLQLLVTGNPVHDTPAMRRAVYIWGQILESTWIQLGNEDNPIPAEWVEETLDVWPGDLASFYHLEVVEYD